MSHLYFWLDLGVIAFPLALSFNKLGHFYKRWRATWVAIAVTALFFLSWDILFTIKGVWGFNDDYLLGLDIFYLPIEEWLFFICVPYACLFLYDQLLVLKVKNILAPIEKYLDFFMMGIAAAFLIKGFGNVYTTTISSMVLVFLVAIQLLKPANKGVFYLCYLVILIPFTIMNGVLTGAKTPEPIVWYNNAENLGVRLGTIPIEDFLYYFLIFGMCWAVFEKIKNQSAFSVITSMKWLSIVFLTVVLSSCGSDKLYSQQSRKFQKHFQSDSKIENVLSIQGGGSFSLPNYPATDNGYMIIPKVFEGADAYTMNGEVVNFDPEIGNHYVNSCIISPFGRNNLFSQNNITTDSFYVPNKLVVNAPADLQISKGDTFTWMQEPKNKYLSLTILDHNDSGNIVANHYLIKDDGQFIMPYSIIKGLNAEYVNLSFSRNYDKNILCSNGSRIKVMTHSESSGLFEPKKATQ